MLIKNNTRHYDPEINLLMLISFSQPTLLR